MVRVLTRYFWVANVIFVVAAAWFVAQIFVIVARDRLTFYPQPVQLPAASSVPAPKNVPYEQFAPIPERNIFHPTEKGLKLLPLGEKDKGPGGGAAPPVQYRLVGTITGPGGHAYAILQEGPDRKQRVHRLLGEIDGGRIVKISRNHILIRRGKDVQELSTVEEPRPQAPPAAYPSPPSASADVVRKLSANRFLVNREDLTGSVANINQFMTQGRFKPNFVQGRPSGFSVSEIRPGTLMEKLGLRNNDVIRKVNGLVINKPEEVFRVYSQIQRDSNVEVEIERSGRTEVLRYEIR